MSNLPTPLGTVINGGTIIAVRKGELVSPTEWVILVFGPNAGNTYATALWLEGQSEWFWGHYFDDFRSAVEDWQAR